MGRIQQVASFQVEGEIFVQPGLRDEVECDKSPFHDVLISLRSNRINLIAHIIKNQRIDKTAFVSGEMVRKVEVGNPRGSSFQLRTGGDGCQRHLRIGVNVGTVQSEGEFVHAVRSTAQRTDKQVFTYFHLYSGNYCTIRNILV